MSRAPGNGRPAGSAAGDATGAAGSEPDGPARPPLDVVQQWFQAVVTHPAGVAAGAASEAAQGLVRLDRGALERLVRRSSRLTAEQRLGIYANAYYARLLECLRDGFPVLTQVLGAEAFDSFAFDYLQRYPSRSYTLNRLAESFPRFLDETRPDRPPAGESPDAAAAPHHPPRAGNLPHAGRAATAVPPPTWPDFLIDLATLELAIAEVFDGPGAEGEPLLAPADLLALEAGGRFAAARLAPVPCLRLLRFRYP
ncbi:MAG TPA: DNA-binding domain-containing protein, partial [Thermoanaerobaculia bacterium]|nr:DNA-binding domain-containing protein [Thermoanaerobaculia bacterium]